MKPAAGALGVVVHPARGAWKSMERQWAREQAQFQRQTRLSDGAREVYQTGVANRQEIIKKFQDLKSAIKERQFKYKNLAEREIYGDEDTPTFAQSSTTTIATTSQTAMSLVASSASRDPSVAELPTSHNEEEEEAGFRRDLEFAKRLSEAEHQGYLRGLARNQ